MEQLDISTETIEREEEEKIPQDPQDPQEDREARGETRAEIRVIPEEVTRNLREYVDICTQIKSARDELKIFTERKSELEEYILQFMQQNDIPAFQTPTSTIRLYDSKSKTPLNKDYLRETLSGKLNTQETDEILALAFDQRPVTQSQKIKVGPKMK